MVGYWHWDGLLIQCGFFFSLLAELQGSDGPSGRSRGPSGFDPGRSCRGLRGLRGFGLRLRAAQQRRLGRRGRNGSTGAGGARGTGGTGGPCAAQVELVSQ